MAGAIARLAFQDCGLGEEASKGHSSLSCRNVKSWQYRRPQGQIIKYVHTKGWCILNAYVRPAVHSKCCLWVPYFILAGAGFHTLEVTRSFTADISVSKVKAYSCLFAISLLPAMQHMLFRYEVSRDKILQLGTYNSVGLQLYGKETILLLQNMLS